MPLFHENLIEITISNSNSNSLKNYFEIFKEASLVMPYLKELNISYEELIDK